MKWFAIAVPAVLLAVPAFAFEKDNQSMGSAATSAKFSDPDDASPIYMNGNSGKDSGNADLSAIHYEYDQASGMYVPVPAKQ